MSTESWHSMEVSEVLEKLETSPRGLSEEEARRRLERFGPNELREEKRISPLKIFVEQFKKVLILILLAAVSIYLLIGKVTDALVILVIVIACVILGFVQEYRAERALKALKRMLVPTATVVREEREGEIPARELVPGDIVLLSQGDKVAADVRLIEVVNFQTDEASLTGESVPVEKITEVVPITAPVSERKNMAFAGTLVTYGRGKGVVVATGMNTEFGSIARMIQEAEEPPTPLEIRMGRMGKWLGFIFVTVCTLMAVCGILRGESPFDMLMLGAALAVATIPEALPAVVTISLAMGVWHMAKQNAIVRKLAATETLGCVTVMCADKTGTLTKGEMTVREIYVNNKVITVGGVGYEPKGEFQIGGHLIDPQRDEHARLLLEIGCLCNNASLERREGRWFVTGDPTEGALIVAAAKAGLDRRELGTAHPRIGEVPFSSERKRMTTIHSTPGGSHVAYVKGAPEIILDLCTHIYEDGKVKRLTQERREEILRMNEDMASRALRVLGFAYRELPVDLTKFTEETVEKNLIFIGLMGMIDPPRWEAKEAVSLCKSAGITPVMITGDHKLTAVAIARELDIMKPPSLVLTGDELNRMRDEDFEKIVRKVSVYARVDPLHKNRIVSAWKREGGVIAVTGDGVNDAPALKNADVGVSMGITGTDVTKEASDMVLADDNFATMVAAVKEGRKIYDNVKKCIAYLLSANIGEVLIFAVAIVLGMPFPLIAAQILWINLVTDGLPALALGADPADPFIMRQLPRDPRESPFHGLRAFLIGYPILMTIWAISVFGWTLQAGLELVKAQTMIFTIIVMTELFQSFSCRSVRYPIVKIGPFANRYLILAVASSVFLQLLVLYVPPFTHFFRTSPLGPLDWAIVLMAATTGFVYLEMSKWWKTRKER